VSARKTERAAISETVILVLLITEAYEYIVEVGSVGI
jgi:hypothetical protein